MMKVCTKCGVEKSIEDFKNQKKKDGSVGKRSECRKCSQQMRADWLARNPDRLKDYKKKDQLKVREGVEAGNVLADDDIRTFCRCSRELKAKMFHKAKYHRGGRSPVCKECKNKEDLEWRANNKDKKRAMDKRYRTENREIFIAGVRKAWDKNRERYNGKGREYWQKNKKVLYQKNRERALMNPEKTREYKVRNYEKHKERYQEQNKKRHYERMKTDPLYRLAVTVRKRTRDYLKGKVKDSKYLKYLGCSLEFLKQHIESQFTEGMSWDNHSLRGWHIDHIKPIALFDLSKEEERYKCFGWRNLQPLWGIENIKKGARVLCTTQ